MATIKDKFKQLPLTEITIDGLRFLVIKADVSQLHDQWGVTVPAYIARLELWHEPKAADDNPFPDVDWNANNG